MITTYNINMREEFRKLKESQRMSNPDQLREAIRTLEEALMPAALKNKEYQDRITSLDNENYRLRGALEVATRTISEVQAVVGPCRHRPYERDPTLAEWVRERLNSEQAAYASATRKLVDRIRVHENAEARLRHEIQSMLKLYNEAAGYILFSEEQAKRADYAELVYKHIDQSLQVLREQAATADPAPEQTQTCNCSETSDPDKIRKELMQQGFVLAITSASSGSCAGCAFAPGRPADMSITVCIREHACTGGVWVHKEVNNP